jgi:hypothetical protein
MTSTLAITMVVTEQNCDPGPGCVYKYTIEPKYIGVHPLPATPFTMKYEVLGGNAPQPGEFTVEGNQAKILKDVVLEGPPAAQLHAVIPPASRAHALPMRRTFAGRSAHRARSARGRSERPRSGPCSRR